VGAVEERLEGLGLHLPDPFAPAGKEFNFRLIQRLVPTLGGGVVVAAQGTGRWPTPVGSASMHIEPAYGDESSGESCSVPASTRS
jgi:hypothetical protein